MPVADDRYVRELDGIRAIAVGLVVFAHYGLGTVIPGGFGVTLFFFLSGYLITTLFFAEFKSSCNIDIYKFYQRRWLRLTPPLIMFVIIGLVSYRINRNTVEGTPVPTGATFAALLYYTNYYILSWHMEPYRIIPFGLCWSLAVEEHFYLAWPWVISNKIRDPRRLCVLVAGLCAAVLIWRCIARYTLSVPTDYTYMATDCRIDSILYGALLRIMFETASVPALVRFFRHPACRILALLALLMTFVIRDENFRETLRYSIQGAALMPFFTAILVEDPNTLVRRVLSSPPMVLIGRLSYSIYLFHLIARTPGEVYFGSPYRAGTVISGLLLTGLISYTMFIFVERPIARLRRRLRKRGSSAIRSPTMVALTESPIITLPREPTSGG